MLAALALVPPFAVSLFGTPVLGVPALAALAAGPAREPAVVVRVVDGDTVKVRLADGRVETVRLIGLNTPESVDPRRPVQCFGREASTRARALLTGRRVVLEADPIQGDRDRYGRLLRYLWLPDGRNFAEVMIAEGFGFEYTYRLPYRYQEEFRAAQRAAREQGRGLWSPATCGGNVRQARGPQAGQAARRAPGPADQASGSGARAGSSGTARAGPAGAGVPGTGAAAVDAPEAGVPGARRAGSGSPDAGPAGAHAPEAGAVAPPGTSGSDGGLQGGPASPRAVAGEAIVAAPCRPGQIKANRNSGIYHLPGGAGYASTRANVACFDSEAGAAAAGFRRARQ